MTITELYLDYFGYAPSDYKPCELGCGTGASLPPHHVLERSQGGKDVIENLMGLCLECHNDYHFGGRMNKRKHREILKEQHLDFMDYMSVYKNLK